VTTKKKKNQNEKQNEDKHQVREETTDIPQRSGAPKSEQNYVENEIEIEEEDDDDDDDDDGEVEEEEINTPPQKETEAPKTAKDNLILGAAVVGAIAGLALGGPRMGVLTGLGLGATAMVQGPAGDAARAIGEVGVEAGKKAKEIDDKHHVVDTTKETAAKAWIKAQEMDQQHHILDKTKQAGITALQKTRDFEKKHNILEKVANTITKGAAKVAESLRATESTDTQQTETEPLSSTSGYSGDAIPEDSIQILVAMGFDRDDVRVALKKSGNNLDVAAALLLGD